MGDSPSIGWLLAGDTSDPSRGGWGGRFVPALRGEPWQQELHPPSRIDSLTISHKGEEGP